MAPIISSAGLLIEDIVSLPGDANCPAITTTEDDIQSDVVSEGPYCQEPTFLQIRPEGNKCGVYSLHIVDVANVNILYVSSFARVCIRKDIDKGQKTS